MAINDYFNTNNTEKKATAPTKSSGVSSYFNVPAAPTTSRVNKESTVAPVVAKTPLSSKNEVISQGRADERKEDTFLSRIGRAILPKTLETAFGIAEEQRKPKELTTAENVRMIGTAQTVQQMAKNPDKVSTLEYVRRGISFGNELDPTNLIRGYKSEVSVEDLPEPTTTPQKIAQATGSLISMSLAQPLIESAVAGLISKVPAGAKFLNTLKTASDASPWTVGYGLKVLKSAGEGGLFGLITENKKTVAENVMEQAGTFAAFTALVYPVAQFFKPIIQSVGKMEIPNNNLRTILNDPQVTQNPISKTLWFKNPKDETQLLKVTANGMQYMSKGSKELVESGVNIKDIPTMTNLEIEAFQTKPSVYQSLKQWVAGKIPKKGVEFSVVDTMPTKAKPVSAQVSVVETPQGQAYTAAIDDLSKAKPSAVRNTLQKLENDLDVMRNSGSKPKAETAIIASINATRDAMNGYQNANKEIILNVPSSAGYGNTNIEIVQYDDGKYGMSTDVTIANSGASRPFGTETYPTREAAIEAGKADIKRFVEQSKKDASPAELADIKKIESALGGKVVKTEEVIVEPVGDDIDVATKTPLEKANEARVAKTLETKIKTKDGTVVTKKDYYLNTIKEGGKLTERMAVDQKKLDALYRKGERADVTGVTADRDTRLAYEKELKEAQENKVPQYVIESKDGTFIELSKYEYQALQKELAGKKASVLPSRKVAKDTNVPIKSVETKAPAKVVERPNAKRIGIMDYHPSYTENMNKLIAEAQDNGDMFPYSKMTKEEQAILDGAWKTSLKSFIEETTGTVPQLKEDIVPKDTKQSIVETAIINEVIKPMQGDIGLGEDADGMLTTAELEANGEAIKLLNKDIKAEGKTFVQSQNGLYLEPVKAGEKKIEVAGEKMDPKDLPKPILTRTNMVSVLKNSKEFKKNPELVVIEQENSKGKYKSLMFKGEKQTFILRASALGLVEKNLAVGTVVKLNPETFKVSGTDTFRVNEYKGGMKQSGSFASVDKFRETMEPIERAIDAVNPIEFPELVKLARQLTGDFPKVTTPRFRPSMGASPLGVFHATGDGKITLNPDLFVQGNEEQAAKTLAHEIGHLIDYLPEKTLARGNILGRLAVLRNFRKDFYAEAGLSRTNTEMQRELWALSKWWKPVDEATAPEAYLAYRKSPVEIYADFISVLFNDPKLAQQMAPESYNTFFNTLDKKPEVKEKYFELQDLLSGTTEELMSARQEDIRSGFARGEDLQAGFAAKKEAKEIKFWERLRQQIDDRNYPILKKQQMAEANGYVFAPEASPRFLLQEQSLADNENFLLAETIDREIVKPIEEAGMIIEDIGEYLLLDRIVNERVNIANPFGFNTKNAPKQMDFLKKTVGAENFKLLEEKVQAFHDLVYKSVEEAVAVGSYNTELFETKIKPNKDHYASFQVVDYMQDYMPATVKGQVGTLKEVANPFVSTILKTIALNRLNSFQRAKNATIKMLKESAPDEIVETKRITSDGKLSIFKVGRDKGGLEVLEDGKMTSYDVDPYIAESFKREKVGDLNMLVSLIDKFNNKLFKPVVTTYNLGFALAFNPIRDIKRNYKMIPNANFIPITISKKGVKIDTAGNLLSAYVQNFPRAWKYAKGELDEFSRSLVESKAINAPVNDFNYDPARDDELGNILKKYGLIAEDKVLTNKTLDVVRKKILKPVAQVLEGVRFLANTFEIVSKLAGAQVRIAGGESGKQLAYNLRNFTGTPNYKVRGKQTATTNAIFVFSNIMKEGLKSDFKMASDPNTRMGYWWKTAKVDLMPKFLMFLAAAGVLGAGIKKWYDKVSEYDKTNYLIIPLGTQEDGKAIYARVPHDETGRLISSVFWKMANYIKDGKGKELQEVFAIGAGQLPSVTPLITVAGNWFQYLSGRNPYDAFHGRNLIDDTTWQAGGGAALKKMVQWTTNNLGFTKFATYDTSKNTGVETFMQVAPLFSSVIKISDYGEQEQLKSVTSDIKKEKAKQTLLEREVVKKYVDEASADGKLTMATVTTYGNKAVKEILGGHMPRTKEEKAIADRIQQKFKVATKRNLAEDPRYVTLIDADSNDEKKAILKQIKDESTPEQYAKIKADLLALKIVTGEVLYSVK